MASKLAGHLRPRARAPTIHIGTVDPATTYSTTTAGGGGGRPASWGTRGK